MNESEVSNIRLGRANICSKCQTAFSNHRVLSPSGNHAFGTKYYHCNLAWLWPELKAPDCRLCRVLQMAFRNDELLEGSDNEHLLEYTLQATRDGASMYFNIVGVGKPGEKNISGNVLYRLELVRWAIMSK
jgi:hypothetical protein